MRFAWIVFAVSALCFFAQAANVPDACNLVTQTEAEAVMGKGSQVLHSSSDYQSLCAYKLDRVGSNNAVRIQVDVYAGP